MNYYLVALFDDNSYTDIEKIQRDLCKKHRMHKNMSMLHITIDTVSDPDMEKLEKVVCDVLKHYKRFKVEINRQLVFNSASKAVSLKVENKGYIIRLARSLNEKLRQNGFKVKVVDNWDLQLPIGNSNYAMKDISNSDYVAACDSTQRQGFYKLAKIDRIELWEV